MKIRIISLLLALCMLAVCAGCSSSDEEKTLSATRESVDGWLVNNLSKEITDFLDTYSQTAKDQGCDERLNEASAAFSNKSLTDFGYVMENCSNTDVANKYTYDASDYDETYYLYFNGTDKNIALEINGDDGSVSLFEVKELSDGKNALQYYYTTLDGRYNLSRMVFSGKNGTVSYSYDLSVRPTRLYTADVLEDGFSTSGDDVFTMTDGALTYTTQRQKLSDVTSVTSWVDEFSSVVWDYYNANSSKASAIDRAESFNSYMLCFTNSPVTEDISTAMQSGEYTSGMYVYSAENESIILSFDGSSKNIGLRVIRGEQNYVFELREIGKRQYSMHFYNKVDDGTYSSFKMALRAEGDARISRATGLSSKPTLVYSKPNNEVGLSWVETECPYYFKIVSGELEFIDVEAELRALEEAQTLSE